MTLEIERMSETAWLLRVGKAADLATLQRVHVLREALLEAELPGLDDLVPGYASILLRCRAESVDDDDGLPRPWKAAIERLSHDLTADEEDAVDAHSRLHKLPVCYGGDHGEDLDAVAQRLELTPAQVIERHSAVEYRVAMLGFAPGFAYLLGLDAALEVPRREQPRTRVPAGSIGLAGLQTGIYPAQLPGGWQLIGRTPEVLFDAGNEQRPCLLMPGDRVRFEPVDAERFQALAGKEDA